MASYAGLSEFLHQENPFGGELTGPLHTAPGVEHGAPNVMVDAVGVDWTFGGEQRTVCKAMRIPYTVRDDDGSVRLMHMLVGVEGVDGQG